MRSRKTNTTVTKGKKDKKMNNDLQNTTQKTQVWATQTHKIRDDLGSSTSSIRRVTLVENNMISHERGKKVGIVITKQTEHMCLYETQIFRKLT